MKFLPSALIIVFCGLLYWRIQFGTEHPTEMKTAVLHVPNHGSYEVTKLNDETSASDNRVFYEKTALNIAVFISGITMVFYGFPAAMRSKRPPPRK